MASAEVLLDRLDSLWRMGIAPNIKEFVDELSEFENEGRAELCTADLEWRWRTHRNIGSISARPSAIDYRSLLGNAWNLPECQQQLIDTEWLARSAWGDKPHIDDFATHYRLSVLQQETLSQQLNQALPTRLVVERDTQTVQVVLCPNDITLGRQNPGEPSSIAWLPEARRLVVADLHQRNLSRNQLRLRRVRRDEFELTNLSGQVTLTTGQNSLVSGQRLSRLVPFAFTLNGLKISVSAELPLN